MISDIHGSALRLSRSESESRRFGLEIARLAIPDGWNSAAREELRDLIAKSPAAVIIVRYGAQRLDLAADLISADRVLLPAGTLNYWEFRDDLTEGDEHPTATVQPLTPEDAALVDTLTRDIFTAYGNHYSANPLFDPAEVAAGYAQWATTCVADPTGRAFLLRDDGVPAGIATVRDVAGHEATWEIELAGITADRRGRGLYRVLLAGIHRAAHSARIGRIVISTQSHNLPPQRAWSRSGYRPCGAHETVHLVEAGLLPRPLPVH